MLVQAGQATSSISARDSKSNEKQLLYRQVAEGCQKIKDCNNFCKKCD